MTGARPGPTAPAPGLSLSPALAASAVAGASPALFPTGLGPPARTAAASRNALSVWSPRRACPPERPVGTWGATTASLSPTPPSRTRSRPPGKQTRSTRPGAYLEEALTNCSSYLALDAVYEGPGGIVRVVDHRRYHRLAFPVLDHDPTPEDGRAFRTAFKGQREQRGRAVRGLSTDGSSLYPKVLQALWPHVPHPLGALHVRKEIPWAVRHARAKLRQPLPAPLPKPRHGRPSQPQPPQARTITRPKQRLADLVEHR
jgi:hypothetical protein